MQKLLPIIVVVLVSLVLWFTITSRDKKSINSAASPEASSAAQNKDSTARDSAKTDNQQAGENQSGEDGVTGDNIVSNPEDFDDRPATEKYKSAEEALKAIKDAAASYDDLVLDQFTMPGEACTWCDSVYSSVKELMLSPDTKADEKAFYAEILAISGRVENLKALVEAAKNAKNPDEANTYTEAMELAVGKDDVISFLSDQLADSNNAIRESSVAALTNQGSKKAVEILYNHSVAQGNADGYYELGIGVGEMVPDEEAWPFLQQKALQKDDYSHLAVKSLLNVGLDGLKIVSDLYSNTDNPEFVKKVLEQAKDHVAFDDETLEYIKTQSRTATNPVLIDWYNQLIKDYNASEQELGQEGQEDAQPFTPIDPQL